MKLSAKAQTALGAVIAKFQSGDLSPVTHLATLKRQDGDDPVPFDTWSFNNRIMAYIQSGGSTDCRGYRQWQSVGRQVQKGSRAAFILVPLTVKKKDKDTGEETMTVRGFRAVAVFAAKDTEGDPLPEYDYTPTKLPPLTDVAERFGIELTWKPGTPSRLGSTNQEGTKMTLHSEERGVFFHELAHAMHARLNGQLKGGQHIGQEVIAEFTAAVLMQLYGTDYTGNAWQYIAMYANDPLVAIMKAMSAVGKVLELLGI